jgi:protein SCO1/2
MMAMLRRAACLGLIACGAAALPGAAHGAAHGAASSLPPSAFADLAFRQHPGAALPKDVRLTDEDGRAVTVGDLVGHGRPVILAFDYFRCTTLCGVVLGSLVAALQEVPLTPGHDYEVVAVSIDPRETPKDAAEMKARHVARDPAIAAATRFLVGDEAEVRRLADAAGFPYRYDPEIEQYAHPAGVVLVSPDGTISRYLLGIDYDPIGLRLGLVEASKGAIASPAAQLLLLCYGYDPAHGKYNLAVHNLMQVTGAVTMLALGALVVVAARGGRR